MWQVTALETFPCCSPESWHCARCCGLQCPVVVPADSCGAAVLPQSWSRAAHLCSTAACFRSVASCPSERFSCWAVTARGSLTDTPVGVQLPYCPLFVSEAEFLCGQPVQHCCSGRIQACGAYQLVLCEVGASCGVSLCVHQVAADLNRTMAQLWDRAGLSWVGSSSVVWRVQVTSHQGLLQRELLPFPGRRDASWRCLVWLVGLGLAADFTSLQLPRF